MYHNMYNSDRTTDANEDIAHLRRKMPTADAIGCVGFARIADWLTLDAANKYNLHFHNLISAVYQDGVQKQG